MPDVMLVSLALSLAWGASAAQNSIVAPTGADTLTVALLGGRYLATTITHRGKL